MAKHSQDESNTPYKSICLSAGDLQDMFDSEPWKQRIASCTPHRSDAKSITFDNWKTESKVRTISYRTAENVCIAKQYEVFHNHLYTKTVLFLLDEESNMRYLYNGIPLNV